MATALIVTSMANVGGTEVATSIQVRALEQVGWKVAVLGDPGPLSKKLKKDGIEIVDCLLYSNNIIEIFRSIIITLKVIKRLRPDIIHCQMARPVPIAWLSLLLSGNRARTKLFWTSRGLRADSYPSVVPFFNRLGVRALGNCRGEEQKLLRYGMARQRTSYLYNSSRLLPSDRRQIRPSEPPLVIGTLAALRPDRRLDHFLLMANQLIRQTEFSRSLEFRIAGDGPAREALVSLTKNLGLTDKVCFLGNVSNVAKFLSELHVSVSTAFSENRDTGAGLSNSVIESMIVGVPMVAYDCAGIDEIVINGKTGYLVPPGDIDSLTTAVISAALHVDEAQTRADAAYFNILSECDPVAVNERLIQLYRDL